MIKYSPKTLTSNLPNSCIGDTLLCKVVGCNYYKMKKYQWIDRNVYWLIPIVLTIIGFGVIGVYCLLTDGFTPKDVSLENWMRLFAGIGALGGFVFLIIDKLLTSRRNNHNYWQEKIPFVVISSPCDPSLNYCDINILEGDASGRGNIYFSICNHGKTNAFELEFQFSKSSEFLDSDIFHNHYMSFLTPLPRNKDGDMLPEYIFSKYSVDPKTREINNASFDICNCLENCQISTTNGQEKIFFVRIVYYSSLNKDYRYKITSEFKVHVLCGESKILNPDSGVPRCVLIKAILLTNYNYA